MKKIAIMQPYLFPYIGYWQLINAVDEFVLLDDVNFIKRGYINRNSILLNGHPHMFTIPVSKVSQNRYICDMTLSFTEDEKAKFLRMIELAYKKAPYFEEVFHVICNGISGKEVNLSEYIMQNIKAIMDYLDIRTKLTQSSKIKKETELHAQEKIIAICKEQEADIYINPTGGRHLYKKEDFEKESLKLFFLKTQMEDVRYRQRGADDFVENLSIIDIMMNNSVENIRTMLGKYVLD